MAHGRTRDDGPKRWRVLADGLQYPIDPDVIKRLKAGEMLTDAERGELRSPAVGDIVDDIPEASVSSCLAQGWIEDGDKAPAEVAPDDSDAKAEAAAAAERAAYAAKLQRKPAGPLTLSAAAKSDKAAAKERAAYAGIKGATAPTPSDARPLDGVDLLAGDVTEVDLDLTAPESTAGDEQSLFGQLLPGPAPDADDDPEGVTH